MDYGEKTSFEDPRDNLNLENWGPEQRNPQNIGNRALNSENITEAPESFPADTLGRIVDLTPKPESISEDKPKTYDTERLKTVLGTNFGDNTVTEIRRAEDELVQTGNASNFYDEIREMSKIATENWTA